MLIAGHSPAFGLPRTRFEVWRRPRVERAGTKLFGPNLTTTGTPQPRGWTIPLYVKYASPRLRRLGVRDSVDEFGLSATRDLGIGQFPRRIAPYVDAIYPMVYPSHYGSGEYGIVDPDSRPGTTVAYSLRDFRRAVARHKALLIPWLQDFSLGRTYTLADIRDEIVAARLEHVKGFMLWNATGTYTRAALGIPAFR